MHADIITIGDEILIGQVVDTNSAWIGDQLTHIGFKVRQITSLSDEEEAILYALEVISQKTDLVIITGGLGPTRDDLTKTALCHYFDAKLMVNKEAMHRIESFIAARGGMMNDLNATQAELPDRCEVIPNFQGTASGMWFEKEGIVYIALPGVPYEMKLMMEHTVIPRLKAHFKLPAIIRKTILIHGIPEAHLAKTLEKWETELSGSLTVAYLPSPGYIRLRISGSSGHQEQLDALISSEIKKLYTIIPENMVSEDFEQVEVLIGALLRKNGKTICTAESCTGGNIARLITSIAGSSDYFKGSIVAYSNEIKENLLGISRDDLEKYGAVSKQIVEQMAKAARALLQTDYAIATSGIAGPGGGTVDKPVGTTWIAVASKDKVVSGYYLLGHLREVNIAKASVNGLMMLIKLMTG